MYELGRASVIRRPINPHVEASQLAETEQPQRTSKMCFYYNPEEASAFSFSASYVSQNSPSFHLQQPTGRTQQLLNTRKESIHAKEFVN